MWSAQKLRHRHGNRLLLNEKDFETRAQRAARYRKLADQARAWASSSSFLDGKQSFERIAEQWIELAQILERD
jgi:hypothetical protein